MGGFAEFFQRLFRDGRSDSQPAGPLPFTHAEFDLKLAWDLSVTSGDTLITGVAQNLRWAHLEAAELWVTAFDALGEKVAREVCYLVPHQIRQGETAHFAIRLPVALAPGTRLQFSYRYRGSDGGDGGTSWSQSFDFCPPACGEIPDTSAPRR